MAYFANSSEGAVFDRQCSQCRFGQEPCPIAMVQLDFNYRAVGNQLATDILNDLVKDDGTCMMFALDPKFFKER